MATSSISGLASGLDTAGIVNQLMALEAVPQSRLRTKVTAEESLLTLFQGLNTKVAALRDRAAELAKPAAWQALTATSSHADVTVTTGSGATPSQFSVTVDQVARTHQLGFATAAALTDVVTGTGTTVALDRLDGSGPVTLDTGDGTLAGLVAAINDPANATGMRATAIRVAEGSYRLQVESVATGKAEDFTLVNGDGSALLGGATVRTGQDAQISLGTGITVTSTTNTFTDLVPGTTLTLASGTTAGTTAEISTAADTAGVATKIEALVEQLNAALTGLGSDRLRREAGFGTQRQALVDTVFPPDGTSLADLGIQLDRTGQVVFDRAAFETAYAADPAGVAARFTTGSDPAANGFAARIEKVAHATSNSTDGAITQAITGRNASIARLEDSIERWDLRLELRRTTLTRQFTALETALSQMNSQSNWLAGQLGALTGSSGS